jgi:hypothetical protein
MAHYLTTVPSECTGVVSSHVTVPVPTPRCPNCVGPMVLSHKFQPEPDGPRMWHFHCKSCKVGLTQANDDDEE